MQRSKKLLGYPLREKKIVGVPVHRFMVTKWVLSNPGKLSVCSVPHLIINIGK